MLQSYFRALNVFFNFYLHIWFYLKTFYTFLGAPQKSNFYLLRVMESHFSPQIHVIHKVKHKELCLTSIYVNMLNYCILWMLFLHYAPITKWTLCKLFQLYERQEIPFMSQMKDKDCIFSLIWPNKLVDALKTWPRTATKWDSTWQVPPY